MTNEYGVNKEAHYFVPMRPLHGVFGLFAFTSSMDRESWVECEVIENRYKVDEGYKVELKAIEPGYGVETFYQCDFKSMLDMGQIIRKSCDNQHVEELQWIEPLCGAAYLVHSGSFVVANTPLLKIIYG